MTANRPNFDASLLRQTLGCYPTGVVVATTLGDSDAPVGLTINSFSSVSLDPPLILWSIAHSAPSLNAFRNHTSFAINILSEQQKVACMQFSQPSENKFAGIEWHSGYDGVPVLDNALAVLQCKTYQRYAGGDHEIVLGEVRHIDHTDQAPLVFHRGRLLGLPAEET